MILKEKYVKESKNIKAAFQEYLEEAVDWDVLGNPLRRNQCYPYNVESLFFLAEKLFSDGYMAAVDKIKSEK